VFRAGTRMLGIMEAYTFEDRAILPGLPFNAYQWVVTDVESTEAAAFALAVGKQAGLLPRETDRLAIRGKKIHMPVKTDAALKAAARRMAAAVEEDGGTTALTLVDTNTGFDKTGFPAPAFNGTDAMPPLFDLETACTTVAAQEAIESLVAADADLDAQLAEPRKRAHDRSAKIAARWYTESATPAAGAWKGMYQSMKVSHADLKTSAVLEVPAKSATAVEELPWGPAGCLYRIVPGFRGLFAAVAAKDRFDDTLFRQIAYRLVALQDENGQWSSRGPLLFSTAGESLTIGRVARAWHSSLSRDPPVKIRVTDPVRYDMMLNPALTGWAGYQAAWPDAAVFPTLASLLFLLEAIDGPVNLAGIEILPEPSTEPAEKADPDKPAQRLTPVEAARRVVRPNVPRQELFDALIASRWPRKSGDKPTPAAGQPEEKAAPAGEEPAEEEKTEDDDLGTFEDLQQTSDESK